MQKEYKPCTLKRERVLTIFILDDCQSVTIFVPSHSSTLSAISE